MRNLAIATSVIKKGTVLLVPDVKFPGGVVKSKYCVALEDGNCFWKRGGCLLACFTTSKPPSKLKSWQVPVAPMYKILGEDQSKTTYIDCRNRVFLRKEQIEKCHYISQLPDDILVMVENANNIADLHERTY